jgi:hypothetical protein
MSYKDRRPKIIYNYLLPDMSVPSLSSIVSNWIASKIVKNPKPWIPLLHQFKLMEYSLPRVSVPPSNRIYGIPVLEGYSYVRHGNYQYVYYNKDNIYLLDLAKGCRVTHLYKLEEIMQIISNNRNKLCVLWKYLDKYLITIIDTIGPVIYHCIGIHDMESKPTIRTQMGIFSFTVGNSKFVVSDKCCKVWNKNDNCEILGFLRGDPITLQTNEDQRKK